MHTVNRKARQFCLWGAILALCAVAFSSKSFASGEQATAADLLRKGVKVNHVSIPIYDKGARNLLAVIRVDHVFKDFARRGMFHIGILPIEVLDGTTLEVQEGARPAEVFEQVERWLGGDAKNLIELRKVKLICNGNSIETDRISVRGAGLWQLAGNVCYSDAAGKLRAERGSFRAIGEHAGHIILEGTQRKEAEFFAAPPAN